MKRIASAVAIFLSVTGLAQAQQAAPEFRFVMSRDMDFFGADLDALFDTSLQSCIRACTANAACQAFTFNSRSNACFPKRGVTEQTPYAGAISAQKLASAPGLAAAAQARAGQLTFLREGEQAAAVRFARDIGMTYAANGRSLEDLLAAARGRPAAQAAAWIGAAVSLSDRADLWTEYARLILAVKTDNSRTRRTNQERARLAAINGYLRGETPGARATALTVLADAYEKSGRGRDMVQALRLASREQPRDDILAALDRAIAKFGFRVTDTKVESDSTAPRICAVFSEPLKKAGVDYETYLGLPEAGLVAQADGNQLCIDGVTHGERYRIVFREGLPAADGQTLSRDVEIAQYVRDREPGVRFPGRAYVLAKSADAALPVETVNLTELDLRLRKLSDRNLLRAVQDGYFGRPLLQWQDQNFASEIAEEIWTGTGEVAMELNRDMTTRLPMGEAIAGQSPGIYALTARVPGADPYDDPGATQWFVLSDLGISTLSGTDGLHVDVRSLSTAAALDGVEVTLVSRANAVLGRVTTDTEGRAVFAPGLTRGSGASAPAMVLASAGGEDLGFLSLTDPAFDLSDRGVEGRAPAGPIDVFLTTDRGAYRAGETIHATALTRDGKALAIDGLPLLAILTRPDGVEYARRVSDGGKAGGHVFALPVGVTAPRGTWRLDLKTEAEGPVLASETFLVEDFLPERIDFDLSLPDAPIRLGETPPLTITARYLFGAPGADLSVEGDVTLRPRRDLAEWPGYKFGRHDVAAAPRSDSFGGETTDADGIATVYLPLPEPETRALPLEVTANVRLADGSARPVERRIAAPVLPDGPMIGIKPLFTDVVAEGSDAAFEVIALNPSLEPVPMQVKWTLNRIETRYQWYQLYGNWNWEPVTRRTRIATGTGQLGSAPLRVEGAVEWGRYELVVERTDGAYVDTAQDFHAGWYAPADASSTPDRLEVSLDKPGYRPGDTANLRIVPQAAGTALVSVLSNRVIASLAVEVPAGASTIPLQVTEDWGAGVYVTATVIRAQEQAAGRVPVRAVGLAHAKVDPGEKALDVSIAMIGTPQPRTINTARVTVNGASPGDDVWLTLAAVDVGILNLTGFESPDPMDHYFGKRRLGVELRDVYGRLIDTKGGEMGRVRSGGDADTGMRMQSPPPTQDLMASFSGPVRIGPDGTAEITFATPAFNGTVRLMAVAWSGRAVGQAAQDVVIRDPVVVTATVPRFLAPGDSSRVLVEVVHADGPSGQMQLGLTRVGAGLRMGDDPGLFTLGNQAKQVFQIPVEARQAGDPSFDLTLVTPDGRQLTQTLNLPVRVNDPVVAQTRRFSLGTGSTFHFTQDVFAGLHRGTGKALLSAGPLARLDAPGLLTALDRYPYGCTEQVTSRAMPLLYLSSVAQAAGLGSGPAVDERIAQAIQRVLTRQASNGAFGLWRAESGDFWLDAYTTDFLSRARATGHAVPDRAFRLALDNLRNRINYAPDFDKGGRDIAYALMVLAREGAASMSDLRYYADVKADAFDTTLALAQLGAALATYGDQTRADMLFARAARQVASAEDNRLWRSDYGTNLRDSAGLLALATEARSSVVNASALTDRIAGDATRRSTQESAWILLAAKALIDRPEASGLLVDGAPVSGPFVQVMEDTDLTAGIEIAAADGAATEITLTTMGVPLVAPDAGGTGFAIRRERFAMDGTPLRGTAFKTGDRFITVLTVAAFEKRQARLMIDDPLPAGIEIDNPNLLRSGDVRALDWLDLSDATHTEFRADRFLAAVDLRSGDSVTLAYVARAVSPGDFHAPAASVEDMYRPSFRARTGTGRVTVSE